MQNSNDSKQETKKPEEISLRFHNAEHIFRFDDFIEFGKKFFVTIKEIKEIYNEYARQEWSTSTKMYEHLANKNGEILYVIDPKTGKRILSEEYIAAKADFQSKMSLPYTIGQFSFIPLQEYADHSKSDSLEMLQSLIIHTIFENKIESSFPEYNLLSWDYL